VDQQLEDQAQRYVNQHLVELLQATAAIRQRLEPAAIQQGVVLTGGFLLGLQREYNATVAPQLDALLSDLLALLARHPGLDRETADWASRIYDGALNDLFRVIGKEFEDLTNRTGLPEVVRTWAEKIGEWHISLANRGRLRIETALGDAIPAQSKRAAAEPDHEVATSEGLTWKWLSRAADVVRV